MADLVGKPAPKFSVRATSGDFLSTQDLTKDGPAVLAFVYFAFTGG